MKRVNLKYWMMSVAVVGFLTSCGTNNSNTEVEQAAEQAHDHADHDGHDHGHDAPDGVVMQDINDGQKVFFANLKDGQVVTSPLKVEFGVEGMEVEPAGETKENSGHHHLLIDHDFIPSGEVIAAGDSTMLHFGKGQTSTEVNLAPGKHKLTMQFANGAHMSFGEKMSTSITVSVEGR